MFAKQLRHSQKVIVLVLVLLAILAFTGTLATPVWALSSTRSQDTATPIQVQLKMDKLPTLGQTATLSCVASSVLPAANTTVEFQLPAGAQIVSGAGSWSGALKPGSPVTLTAVVAFTQLGQNQVACRAHAPVDAKNVWGDKGSLYFTLDQTTSQVGFAKHNLVQADYAGDGELQPSQTPVDESAMQAADAAPDAPSVAPAFGESAPELAPASPAGTVTLTGTWKYTNRAGTSVGANQFIVRIVNGTTYGHLTWCYTNTTGYFSCSVPNPGSAGLSVRIYSFASYNPYSDALRITDGTGTDWSDTYFVYTTKKTFTDGSHSLGTLYVPNGSAEQKAFWLKDDLDRAWKFVYQYAGGSQSPVETAGPTTVYWWPSSTVGTYYNLGGVIHLRGEDPYSHDTVIHEYGHNMMYNKYGHWFPTTGCPSPHYLNYYSSANCAWTEGWADYLPLAVNNDPSYHWADGSYINLDTGTWGTYNFTQGDTTEGRVAGALWDIMDTPNDGYDTYDGTFNDIWDVLYHQTDNNFKEYWTAWKSRGHNQSGAVMSIYQNTINYRKPATPVLIGPANGYATTSHTVTMSWNAASFATSYKIVIRSGSSTGTILVNTTTTSKSYPKSFTDHGYYYWTVSACNANGCSAWTPYRYFHVTP